MASKNIAITEDLYRALEGRKINDESFTKVISRLLQESEKPSNYFGAWKDLSPEELERIKRAKKEIRDLWLKPRGK